MASDGDNRGVFNNASMFSGFFYGLMVGAVVAFFRGPRVRLKDVDLARTRQQVESTVRETVERAIPPDPIERSMEEGKAAARRRRNTQPNR